MQGLFTNTLYDTLENIIRNTLKSASDIASSHLEDTQQELYHVRDALNSTKSAPQTGQDKVNIAQSAFDAAVAEVNRLRNKIDSICSIRSCGTGKDKL